LLTILLKYLGHQQTAIWIYLQIDKNGGKKKGVPEVALVVFGQRVALALQVIE
jgi:hypothetical protein